MQNEIEVLWENYYIKKPLTLWEFVQKQTNLVKLFPSVEKALKRYNETFLKNPLRVGEVYLTGPAGTGKGVYSYIVMAYRLYLAMLLRNPKTEIFKFSPDSELSLLYCGERSDEMLKGFIHFIKNIQNPDDPMFVINEGRKTETKQDVIVINIHEDKLWPTANYGNNEIVFKYAKNSAGFIGTNPIIVEFDCEQSNRTESVWDMFNKLEDRLNSRFLNKDLFTSLIVEKYPDNLYSDLMDQHIQELQAYPGGSKYLIEGFVPPYLRDVTRKEDEPKDSCFIDLYTGYAGDLSELKEYRLKHPKNPTINFPSVYSTVNGDMELLPFAKEHPKQFINDFLGIPIPRPFTTDVKVTDTLSALQTVRKLIRDYHIQFTFGPDGGYLSIPEVNTKIKL